MSRIPQSFIDDLLNRLDIVEIVDERVKLKRTGKNYAACCPFHEEKTPSFTVSQDKQFYYCFGCGATGTALSFIMEYERQGFIDAVETLARRAGVEVPKVQNNPEFDKKESRRKQIYEILEEASAYYEEQLKTHRQRETAVKYLQKRGLSGAIAKRFGLGFAPSGWDNILLRIGQNENKQQLLVESGLVIEKPDDKRRYDRFRNRIVYPIRDGRGRYIGFGGRVLGDDKPKYLNSPETPVFEKGRELYGLYEAKKENRNLDFLIVVEGYMDVIALAQYQIWNAVATLGTACGEEHLKLAFRHVNEVIFCFDGDKAGRSAAKRGLMNSLSSMEDGRQIKFLFLPEGQDPDTLVRQIGAERFTELVKRARPMEEFLFEIAADGIDLNSMEGRARFSKMAAPLIHQLPEGVYKALMFDNLAKRTGLSSDALAELTEIPEDLKRQLAAPPREAYKPRTETSSAKPQVRASIAPERQQVPEERPNHDAPNYDDADINYASYDDAPPADYDTLQHALAHEQAQNPTIPRSKLSLSPARRALILLLDQPQLLQNIPQLPELSDDMFAHEDCQQLYEIIDYLRQRPDASFSNIIGYWGGAKGIDQQQALAALVANQFFGSLKTIETYDALREVQDCLNALNAEDQKFQRKKELKALNQKGLAALSPEERQRFRELTKAPSQ